MPSFSKVRGTLVIVPGQHSPIIYGVPQPKACRIPDLTGSVLHRIRRRDLWLDLCLCVAEGVSVRETAGPPGICKNTAFAWRHRVIVALGSADSRTVCEGIVEVAQLPLIRSFKGLRRPKEADMSEMDPVVQRNPIAYRRLFPECRRAALVVAVDRLGTAREGAEPVSSRWSRSQ